MLLNIQFLRFVAAMLVVLYHTAAQVPHSQSAVYGLFALGQAIGFAGVDIFFVISGFIMAFTTLDQGGRLASLGFTRRRLGGDPGIGKSTLLLQAVSNFAGKLKCLYVTGEESLQQISMRARRLGLAADELDCLTETCVERVMAVAAEAKPDLLVIDSIQTLYSDEVQSAPGSISQVRESAAHLVRFAKENNCAIFLVGHVTKEGALAGPRVLEHMVDAVLYFESDSGSRYRIIRSFKNRFGTVNETLSSS